MIEQWPPTLSVVEPIKSISVTVASAGVPCLLAIHAPRSVTEAWPTSIVTAAGIAVHSLIEQLASSPARRIELLESNEALQSSLLDCFATHRIDAQKLGNAWQSCQRTLKRALESMPRQYKTEASEKSVSPSRKSRSDQYVSSSSTEGWVCDRELGIRGKFDLRLELDGVIRVDDYKTGCVNRNEEKLEKWERQVAIYTLVSVRQHPDRPHVARIIAADGKYEVDTSTARLRKLERELIEQKSRWPTEPKQASEIASMCPSCRLCSARHVCPKYLSKKPWIEDPEIDSEDGPSRSWDVWGKLVKTSTGGRRHALVLESSTGRVIVNGFDQNAGVSELCLDTTVGLFGLRKDKAYTESRPVFRAVQSGTSVPTKIMLKACSDLN